MKHNIIEIDCFSKAKPIKNTWYKYYDDILISVICRKTKSYIRRKIVEFDNKRDNKMCFWHYDWQYSKIETNYGLSRLGERTYEICIFHNTEKHIIDSLVNNIAIEFQHTLSISLNEIDSRFIAHNSKGYIPFFMIDLTNFDYSHVFNGIKCFKLKKNNERAFDKYTTHKGFNEIAGLIKKFITSLYYKNNGLLIDFKDKILHFVPSVETGYIVYEKDFFLNNLVTLNEMINQQLLNEKNEREISVKLEVERLEKEQNVRAEEYKVLRKQEIIQNQSDRKNSPNFRFYRECLTNTKFPDILREQEEYSEIIEYKCNSKNDSNLYIKSHIYTPEYECYKLEYATYSQINVENSKKEFQYIYSIISLSRRVAWERKTFVYKKDKYGQINLCKKKIEIIDNFLHSTENYALIEYDEKEKIIRKDYYLFNVRIDSQKHWENLSLYFKLGLELGFDSGFDLEELDTCTNILDEIKKEDKWNFRQGVFQYRNFVPEYIIRQFYPNYE